MGERRGEGDGGEGRMGERGEWGADMTVLSGEGEQSRAPEYGQWGRRGNGGGDGECGFYQVYSFHGKWPLSK